MEILGVDIGGSGIKGAPVDTSTGTLVTSRFRIPTPAQSKPKPIARVVRQIVDHFEWEGPVGIGYPGVVQNGFTRTATNLHNKWIDLDASGLFSEQIGLPVTLINDADAAGIAEMAFGAGKSEPGTVIVVTVGTGIGTAVFSHGVLVPNTELGQMDLRGKRAEVRTSDAARQQEKLSWKKWATRFDEYLGMLEMLFAPDLFIVGGGVCKKADRFIPYLTVNARVVPARLSNEAGIIGAAMVALP
ncbi:MAG: ROK family protein [Anaerolineae bacterium]|nr:ROK family protein [Anaerolineae bacterium]